MIKMAMDYIGRDRLENIALSVHVPAPGNYVIVNPDRTYKIISQPRAAFNSKYCTMDYYSRLVSMNKPIKSKLMSSNNYHSFFCKNIPKLTHEDIDDYYDAMELPAELSWYRTWIKENIYDISERNSGLIKVFFPGSVEEYREFGLSNWLKKSISITKFDKEKGASVDYNINAKKPYSIPFKVPYLVSADEGLNIKFFYDILHGLFRQHRNMLYVWDGGMYATNARQGPPNFKIMTGVLFVFEMNARGQMYVVEMEPISGYNPIP